MLVSEVFSFFLVYVSFAGRKLRLKSNPQHRLGERLQFTKANKCPPQAPKIRFDKMIVWKLPAAGAEIFRLWARFPAGNVISIKAGGGKMSKISSALPGRSHNLPNPWSHIAIATHPPPLPPYGGPLISRFQFGKCFHLLCLPQMIF